MELVLAFAVGWYAGSKGGDQGFQEVVAAARELRRSEEFRALVSALRSQFAGTLRVLADVLAAPDQPVTLTSLVERVNAMTKGARPTSSAS